VPTRTVSALEQLNTLLSDEDRTPSNRRTEWDYLISLFTDAQKSQYDELRASAQSMQTEKNGTLPSRSAKITFNNPEDSAPHTPQHVMIPFENVDNAETKIRVPANFLGIESIPYIKIGQQSVRLALPQLLEIEKQRPEPNKDYIKILEAINANLP